MSKNIQSFPAEVADVIGGGGPGSHGPATGYTYALDLCTNDGTVRVAGASPSVERYPDTIDVTPLKPGTMVTAYQYAKDLVLIGTRELPYFRPCTGGNGLSLLQTIQAMSPIEKAALRSALGVT